jgi:hypothetical protein
VGIRWPIIWTLCLCENLLCNWMVNHWCMLSRFVVVANSMSTNNKQYETTTRTLLLAVWEFMVQQQHQLGKSMVHPLLAHTCWFYSYCQPNNNMKQKQELHGLLCENLLCTCLVRIMYVWWFYYCMSTKQYETSTRTSILAVWEFVVHLLGKSKVHPLMCACVLILLLTTKQQELRCCLR